MQKIIIDEIEYITPINEEISEVTASFQDVYFMTSVCNGFNGEIQYHNTEPSFTISDVSVTLMDCELSENFEYEGMYFWDFFYDEAELAQPFNFSIEEEDNFLRLSIINAVQVEAIYHSQNTVSIPQINQQHSVLSVYPNPASDKLFIRDSENTRSLSVKMTNLLGQEVMYKMLNNNESELDILHLDNGVYLLRIYDEHGFIIHSEKLIKNTP